VTIHDAIGIRVVCAFRNDVFAVRNHLAELPGYEVVNEKDFIRHAKDNGYRSYHMIMRTADGRIPEGCEPDPGDSGAEPVRGVYLEIQLRTISMDTWAALDHQLQYKKGVLDNARLVRSELKRCADELASTDLSMQAIRDMIMDERKESQ
jgi:ppGpp synthetase/RelA/SpoT-type nucleotidyltranferase